MLTGYALLLLATSGLGDDAARKPAPSAIAPAVAFPNVVRSAIGVTRAGTRIDLFLQEEDLDLKTDKMRLVLIGGLDGDRHSVDAVIETLRWFHDLGASHAFRQRFTVSAIPCANPAALPMSGGDQPGRDISFNYPPAGTAYHDQRYPDEAAYLWRWLGMHAPDLVIDLRVAPELAWQVPEAAKASSVLDLDAASTVDTSGDLVVELGRHDVCLTGSIPAIRLQTPAADVTAQMKLLLAQLDRAPQRRPSAARLALLQRLDRTPAEVAEQLAKHYGHDLQQVVYIPAVALIGQLRLRGAERDQRLQAVKRIVKPYVDGSKSAVPTNGSGLSGHLIFTELAGRSEGAEHARYLELARVAADMAFDADGATKSIMPFHSEMSDAAFMGGPILSGVGRLSQDDRYFAACARHLQTVRDLDLRPDGLYRHSPLDEAAWGRGNGFPALGLALCLSDFPVAHPQRARLLEAFQQHCRALVAHQDPTGCWHQVIDRPESYRELSSTCMITYALARGIREGWLPRDEFRPHVGRAWYAIRTRVGEDGQLVDVCTGTGKQRSLRDYYDRPAILGRDPRGGAMALLVATELSTAE